MVRADCDEQDRDERQHQHRAQTPPAQRSPALTAMSPLGSAIATALVSAHGGSLSRRIEWVAVVGHPGTHASRAPGSLTPAAKSWCKAG
jgi:hypothetical protein